MLQRSQKRNDGFTIIEVLIVLAIAGLIMVVVFLAVPNLQRNSRNNQTKTEANNLVSAYGEVSANLNGKVLVAADKDAVTKAANINDTNTNITAAQTSITNSEAAISFSNTEKAVIVTDAKCPAPTATNSVTPLDGNSRQVAIFYAIETSDGVQWQCVTS